ncbi:CGNR zinc finger domain-containing protein [Cupriavidus plantarum]|uniref:Putative RNA-binding Zn ribbon-like protein n=1 Tax=Cupriavidus plantarum TaxID=942865 RepID=A0A316ETH3_9BURK|nr:CGNR zinc finger domain-containing protein [Cupriavidus plantarum]NYI00895.1 putative RNA-binding Zn ribbon-like protein [Cupriavidus plantarum]PWK35306.1 putative RNA-binding Zn ribbon-like protein [Cupriavidus plantarum]REE93751.1 putative RNA-binding Zn ribbon-like protein [Cupriavidus plantarum]RLK39172.1 putative RNA-binding Zn ribbon-like protein [Cupriavidus plantarum]
MSSASTSSTASSNTATSGNNPSDVPRLLADHPALDLLNTLERALLDAPLDRWQSDEDVWQWLERVSLLPNGELPARRPEGMLDAAVALRESLRSAVSQRKRGDAVDVTLLNEYLGADACRTLLTAAEGGKIRLARVYPTDTPMQCLVPLALSAADLLANGDFTLIRQCESETCTMWFYDRTRAHRRRWCSMALCGNRHKVAAYRRREANASAAASAAGAANANNASDAA